MAVGEQRCPEPLRPFLTLAEALGALSASLRKAPIDSVNIGCPGGRSPSWTPPAAAIPS